MRQKIFGQNSKHYVWQTLGTDHHLAYAILTVKHGGGSIMLGGMLLSDRDRETGQDWGKDECSQTERYLNKTCSQELRWSSFGTSLWLSLSSGLALNPIEHLWIDLMMEVQSPHPIWQSLRGSARKNGINCPDPGVQSLSRLTQDDSKLQLLPKDLLQSAEIRVWIQL